MELWRAQINAQTAGEPMTRRTIVATDNGTILSHVIQQKLENPLLINGQPTEWSETKELAGKFFMMTGGFTSENTDAPPETFLAAIAPFEGPNSSTKIMRSECGQLANVVMSPLIVFVNRTWVDTPLEKVLAKEFVDRATRAYEFYFMVQPISSTKLETIVPEAEQ